MQTYNEKPYLTLLLRVGESEEYENLHYWRAAFGAATDIEPLSKTIFAGYVWQGCWHEIKDGPMEASS